MTIEEINAAATIEGRAYADANCGGLLTPESWSVANAAWHRLCALYGIDGGGPWGNVYVAPPEWPLEPTRMF